MRGRPGTIRCPKCKLRGISGERHDIVFLGEQREPAINPLRGRSSGGRYIQYMNKCERCDHVWWCTRKGICESVRAQNDDDGRSAVPAERPG